ncbi:MAG: glycosyltransferase family 39 protein [Leptospiraceae bacterium]|nr:glycosyltransferase family 39 protein [Leptospiraceae bacterium]MCP5511622.1 glycosyltransferase family 39 protein [Leptospiraceae bacterium]
MKLSSKQTKLLFWVIFILALVLRLWGIHHELNDYHHFRQTYTAMFAKNFYEHGLNLFSPQIDILNYKNVSEFQIYPFLVAILYKIFGYHDILGRLLSLFFSMATIGVLYRLIAYLLDEITGLFGILLYAILPLSVFYGRVFMLEPMMLFLSVSMIYTFTLYLDTEKTSYFALAVLSTAGTLLIKIPTAYMLFPMLYLLIRKQGPGFLIRPRNYIFGILSILPALYWYFLHARFFPQDSIVDKELMGMYYSSDAWDYYIALMKSSKTWKSIYLISIAEFHLAISGFLFFLGGVILLMKRWRNQSNFQKFEYNSGVWVFFYWYLGFNVFILSFIAPNLAHEYYQLPIILPSIGLASYYLRNAFEYALNMEKGGKKTAILAVNFLLLLGILPFSLNKINNRLQQDTFYNDFSEQVRKLTSKEDLVIIADNTPRTEVFYFSDRKGFQFIIPGAFQVYMEGIEESYQKQYIQELEELRSQGGKYFLTPYVELPGFLPWLHAYLSENYECKLGCEVTRERSLMRDRTIPGFIYDLSSPLKK